MDDINVQRILCFFAGTILCVFLGLGQGLPLLQADRFTDGECLGCHGDPTLRQALPGGGVRSLSVNPTLWNRDVHQQAGYSCTDCHLGASPGSHPVGGFDDVDCAMCHAEDCETFALTIHAGVPAPDEKRTPDCYECHTRHAVRPKNDPEASIGPEHVAAVCASCHPDEAGSSSWIARAADFRLSGHKKENISLTYDMSYCTTCHFRNGAHGQPGALAEQCMTCHGADAGSGVVFTRSVHASTVFGGNAVTTAMRFFSGLVLMGLIGGAGYLWSRRIPGPNRDGKESSP